jgi:hypothetical protein
MRVRLRAPCLVHPVCARITRSRKRFSSHASGWLWSNRSMLSSACVISGPVCSENARMPSSLRVIVTGKALKLSSIPRCAHGARPRVGWLAPPCLPLACRLPSFRSHTRHVCPSPAVCDGVCNRQCFKCGILAASATSQIYNLSKKALGNQNPLFVFKGTAGLSDSVREGAALTLSCCHSLGPVPLHAGCCLLLSRSCMNHVLAARSPRRVWPAPAALARRLIVAR